MAPRRARASIALSEAPISSTTSRVTATTRKITSKRSTRSSLTCADDGEDGLIDEVEVDVKPRMKAEYARGKRIAEKKRAVVDSSEETDEDEDDDEESIPVNKALGKATKTEAIRVKQEAVSEGDEDNQESDEEIIKPKKRTNGRPESSKAKAISKAATARTTKMQGKAQAEEAQSSDDNDDSAVVKSLIGAPKDVNIEQSSRLSSPEEDSQIVKENARILPSSQTDPTVVKTLKDALETNDSEDEESSSRASSPGPVTPPVVELIPQQDPCHPAKDDLLVTPLLTQVVPSFIPLADDGPKKRLIIHKMALVDFKSYAGRQEIGPFHKVEE